jgi:hypothetical protein
MFENKADPACRFYAVKLCCFFQWYEFHMLTVKSIYNTNIIPNYSFGCINRVWAFEKVWILTFSNAHAGAVIRVLQHKRSLAIRNALRKQTLPFNGVL